MSRKFVLFSLCIAYCAFIFTICSCTSKDRTNKIIIYSCAEDYRNEYYLAGLQERFPDYSITLDYMTSGNAAAKLNAEGTKTEGDILLSWESGYLDMLQDSLATLDWVDYSIYLDDLVDGERKSVPENKNSGAIIINRKILNEKNLAYPQDYEDLLKPEYKGLISMPSPKSSGTGYMFLKNLVNARGEDEAFAYFDRLSENILQYTSSGSGPINALVQGEAAIALGMTGQAVTVMNDGSDLEIRFFAEGAPYSMYEHAIVSGKENKDGVKEVFDYLATVLTPECDALYFPEQVFKDKVFVIDGYPTDIPYGDMSNNTSAEKTRLLARWDH